MASSGTVLSKKMGPCGGDGGSAKDMDVTGITRIVKIGVRHGWSIDALTTHFVRNGHEESTDQWGGMGGTLTEISLEPLEYITSVKGYTHTTSDYASVFVRSLKIETNLRVYGPFGREQGVPFELPAINGEIIGFFGRSGRYVDAVGVYVKKRA